MKFIPWHNTQSLYKGIEALNRMYNSLSKNSALKLFLDKHCLHLLKPLEGNTGVPVEYVDNNVLNALPDVVSLDTEYNIGQFVNLPGQVGVYVFFIHGQDVPTQCGSSIAFANRIRSHYYESNKGQFIYDTLKISDYKWVPIKYGLDYVGMYNSDNPMTPEEEVILTSFTQQEIRSIEQSYSSYAKPTNYKGIQVSTWHNNWYEGFTGNNTTSKRITWTTKDSTEYTRNSVDAGVNELGFSRKHVSSVAKVDGATLNTQKYGIVTVSIEGVNKVASHDKRYGTPMNTFVDTSDLKVNNYYFYDTDMNQLQFGPFPTARETNEAMGLPPKYGGVHLWANYMHPIYAASLNMSVYIVKRAVAQAMPIIVESLTDNTTTEYPSMNAALKVIAPGKTNDNHLLRLVVRGQSFSYKGGPSYKIRYKHAEHHEVAIKRYLALGYKL